MLLRSGRGGQKSKPPKSIDRFLDQPESAVRFKTALFYFWEGFAGVDCDSIRESTATLAMTVDACEVA